jgi:tetratricopeptide (TPR) repeat protein
VLRHKLTLPNVDVKIQEDFKSSGADTLRTLADYVKECEAVVHFVGDMAGSTPEPSTVDDLLARHPALEGRLAAKGMGREALKTLTYTQWEAWLAVGFDTDLVIVAPAESAERGRAYVTTEASRTAQTEHLKRLKAIDRYPEQPFTNTDNLVVQVFLSAVRKALIKAGAMPARQPRNLPFASLGELFKGRDAALEELRAALTGAKGVGVAGRALHGLGGIGKTRLAIEYAWAREADYSALLFVRADDAATLNAGLAGLAGAEVLELPEKEAREDEGKIAAVLHWLEANPTWLLILDNVDDEKAVAAVAILMPRLKGGHVVVTGRAANFPPTLRPFELDALDEGAATQFLLERTAEKRETARDDAAQAGALARELGGLALGLEQAGAQIATDRIGFARYLKLWNENRDKVLARSDATLTGSEKTLATAWATSVARLSPESRRLLDRLAMLAPDPTPNALLEVPVPGESEASDAYQARAGLYAYSLATQTKAEDGPAGGLFVHRLMQDFARRAMTEERRAAALREALGWVNAAFVGAPDDVRTWPVLDPLAPHALAVARRADDAGIAEPTGRLFNQLGLLSQTKARYAEAEPLMRRALAVAEARYGPEYPNVAIRLNNLALLLQDTNRLAEAEPLFRRALKIFEASYGPDHPHVATDLNNLAHLLRAANRLAEAEPLFRRALKIDEASHGPDHPEVAIDLNNLAGLLRATSRLAEAEPLYRRALKIDQASYGPDHPNVGRDLNNLAELLRETNRYAEAEPLLRRALKIDESGLGPDHPSGAIRLNNLASLLRATNRLAEAEPLFRRALKIDEASLGPDHPNVAIRLNNLASLLRVTNRLAEAEPLYRRALAIREKSYGPDHPDVAQSLNNLALLLQATNRLGEAEPLYRSALAIFETSLGADHPNTMSVRKNLAALKAARESGSRAERPKKGFFGRLFGRS